MKRTYRVEKLAKKEERQIIKRIFILSVFSLILIFVLLTVGIPTLGKLADFLGSVFRSDNEVISESSVITPPKLDTLPPATNERKIKVGGFAPAGNSVEVYLNEEKVDEVGISEGKFEVLDIALQDGENRLRVKALDDSGNVSDFSQEAVVILDTGEPFLEVSSPSESQTFERDNRIKVEGKTEKDAQVFANGFLANVDFEGNFEVSIPLYEGDSEIEIKALDEAGNSKIIKVKVSFKK